MEIEILLFKPSGVESEDLNIEVSGWALWRSARRAASRGSRRGRRPCCARLLAGHP